MADQSGAVNQPMPTDGSQHGNIRNAIASGEDYAQNAKNYYFRGLNGPQLLGTFAGPAPVDQGADAPDNWAAGNADAQQPRPNRLSANNTINTPTVGQPFLPQTADTLPKAPAAAKAPVPALGKAGSVLAFGAKIAASMCSPCDMPNSPTNKKHMTGASPAVTEANEHSEEIGKPEVVETEHSEAEAKQPEEGIKSATLGLWDRIRAKKERGGSAAKPGDKDYPDAKSWKKVTAISKESAAPLGIKSAANYGRMLGNMFSAAAPAADNAADLATSLGAKTRSAGLPPPLPRPAKPIEQSVYAVKPGSPMEFPQPPAAKPVSLSGPTAPPPPVNPRRRYYRPPPAPVQQ
jgi:hypothetical protein